MKHSRLVLAALIAGGVLSSAIGYAASSGTSAVTLAASATARLQVDDPTMTLTPTATDYDNNNVQVTGASGLRVRVGTNSTTGAILYVKCADASPQITLTDLLVKTQSAAGPGGSTLATYTAVTPANQLLWSTGTTQPGWLTVYTDIQIQNLWAYPDAMGGGTTNYTDNLTYTVVAQ